MQRPTDEKAPRCADTHQSAENGFHIKRVPHDSDLATPGPLSTTASDPGRDRPAVHPADDRAWGDYVLSEVTLPFGLAGDFQSQPSPVDLAAMERDTREWQMRQVDKEPRVSESMRPLVLAMVEQTSTRIRHDVMRELPKAERLPRNRYLARKAMKANLRVIDGGIVDGPEVA